MSFFIAKQRLQPENFKSESKINSFDSLTILEELNWALWLPYSVESPSVAGADSVTTTSEKNAIEMSYKHAAEERRAFHACKKWDGSNG